MIAQFAYLSMYVSVQLSVHPFIVKKHQRVYLGMRRYPTAGTGRSGDGVPGHGRQEYGGGSIAWIPLTTLQYGWS